MGAPDALTLRRKSEALAAGYPGLLAQAQRVAAVVAQGVHGRRRAGQGETFWQYRNYDASDSASRIDWRRSARGDQLFVRETEWEAANTVWMWRAGDAGMDWASSGQLPTKKDRASVLQLALASLLMRAGERCAMMGESERPRTGTAGLEKLAATLFQSAGEAEHLNARIPSYARLLIAGDFLEGETVWRERISRLAARPAKGVLLHIIDPAEESFPYKGRVKMTFPGSNLIAPLIVGRAERAQEAYREKFDAHKAAMVDMARRLDWTLITHHTDQPATAALSALYAAFEKGKR